MVPFSPRGRPHPTPLQSASAQPGGLSQPVHAPGSLSLSGPDQPKFPREQLEPARGFAGALGLVYKRHPGARSRQWRWGQQGPRRPLPLQREAVLPYSSRWVTGYFPHRPSPFLESVLFSQIHCFLISSNLLLWLLKDVIGDENPCARLGSGLSPSLARIPSPFLTILFREQVTAATWFQ